MTTITWDINTLERKSETGEITTVHYTVNAESDDGEYRAGSYGSIGLDPADLEDMIPYSEVTKEQCIEWIQEKMGEDAIDNIIASLEGNIESQVTPKTFSGVPW